MLPPEGEGRRELEAAGVPVAHFPVDSFRSPGAISGAFQLARYIRRHKIRLVHTFDYPATVFAVPAARFLTSATVVLKPTLPSRLDPARLSPAGPHDGPPGGRPSWSIAISCGATWSRRSAYRPTGFSFATTALIWMYSVLSTRPGRRIFRAILS